MFTDAKTLLRGVLKLVAVVAAAGLAGAGIGIGLAKLSGNDGDVAAALPAPVATTSTSTARTSTSAATTTLPSPTQTQPTTETSTTPVPNRQPRVKVISARLILPPNETGRARVTVRVRVTSRSDSPITSPAPALLTGQDVVQVDPAARVNGGPLLRPLAPGAAVTDTLRFTPSADATRRLTVKPRARLRIVDRIVVLKLKRVMT